MATGEFELAKEKGLFTGRRPDKMLHERIKTLRLANFSIAETARIAGCSEASVKRVWSKRNNKKSTNNPARSTRNPPLLQRLTKPCLFAAFIRPRRALLAAGCTSLSCS